MYDVSSYFQVFFDVANINQARLFPDHIATGHPGSKYTTLDLEEDFWISGYLLDILQTERAG